MSISKKSSKSRLTSDDIREQLSKSKVYDLLITRELEKSFMDYAMSVIVSRALPDVRDGFKPVHRRILYAAYGLGMFADKPYKKSARLVGEVIGKYHPHGDSSVYEAMVRMAQDFSMRYLLIDGHGNFGSVDGDSPAAMRYTEARLSKISDDILESIDKDTVDFADNYDGSEKEPVVLPASFPNLLANGTNGIAVGMATNMPTHNIVEICNAIKAVIANKSITIDELMHWIKGPDFPTRAQIIGTSGIRDYFHTGKGSVTIRSKCDIEELPNGKHNLIITEIPYNVNKTSLIERIVELVKQDEIKDITDLRDESNRDGIRIVIELKRDVIPEIIFNKLCKSTQLQVNFSVNNLALVKGQPRILNLRDIIDLYLEHQHDVITRKAIFELKKAEDRAHILRGLLAAISDIDLTISIIKNSKDVEEAAEKLMSAFNIDDIQAKAILEMRLRVLSGLEHQKLTDELNKLVELINELKIIINSEDRRNEIIIEKLDYFVRVYGDERRTEIIEGVSSNIDDEDLIPVEDIVITMSNNGWFKRMPIDTYRVQHRGGSGVLAVKTHEDDSIQKIIISNTHSDLLFFTSEGRVYRIRGHKVPIGSRQSKGVPANNFLNIEKNEKVINLLTINNPEDYKDKYLFFVTQKGIIKRVPLSEFESIRANGKIAITLDMNDKLFAIHITSGQDEIFIGSNSSNLVRFKEESVRPLGRTARGIKGISLNKNEQVIGTGVSSEGEYVLSIGVNGVGKLTPKEEYRMTNRGTKGITTLKINAKTGGLACVKLVNLDDQILLIANSGNIIRLKADSISIIGRSTSGVKLMDLTNNEKVQYVAVFKATDDEEIQDEEHSENNQENLETHPNPEEQNSGN